MILTAVETVFWRDVYLAVIKLGRSHSLAGGAADSAIAALRERMGRK